MLLRYTHSTSKALSVYYNAKLSTKCLLFVICLFCDNGNDTENYTSLLIAFNGCNFHFLLTTQEQNHQKKTNKPTNLNVFQ